MKDRTQKYINEFVNNHKELEFLIEPICKAVDLIVNLKPENKLLTCGNGGSAADSEHITGEFLKSFMLKRKVNQEFKDTLIKKFSDGEYIADNLQQGIKAIPLTSFIAHNTAFMNDCDAKFVFAQLVNSLGIKDDVLIAISTSGNSKNIINASKVAMAKGIKVIALTGETGGELKQFCDVLINVPSKVVWKIQEYHLPIYHLICLCVESELFDE